MSELPSVNSEDLKIAARKAYYRTHLSEFFSRELKISTKALGGAQPFIPNPVQVPILKGAEKQLKKTGKIRQLIFKCRQPGISTYSSGVIWNRVSMFQGVYAFIIAQDKGTVENIFTMHDVFWKRMSPDIRRPQKYYNKGSEMVLGETLGEDDDLDSRLLVGEAKNINLGVGRTVHFLHSTETCRYPSDDSIKESLIPACSDFPGTVRIWESTAHFGGGADWFRDQCDQARAKKSVYDFFFVEWWKMPEYALPLDRGEKLKLDVEERHLAKKFGLTPQNIKWRRNEIRELKGDIDMFRLSYPMDYDDGWITKNSCTFDRKRIAEMEETVRPPVKRFRLVKGRDQNEPWMMVEDPEGEFWVWELPQRDVVYDVGADVADGHEDGDYSVAEVIRRGTNEQVAEYRSHILSSEYGDALACIGRFYNHAQVAPEVDSGITVAARLNAIYDNVYIWRKRDTVAVKFTGKLGWETTYESKRFMVENTRTKIYYKQALVRSRVLLDELKNFGMDWTPTGMITYRAFKGKDDCVMAWMIALQTSADENYDFLSVREAKQEAKPLPDPAYYDAVGLQFNEDTGTIVDTGSWR